MAAQEQKQIESARALVRELAGKLDIDAHVRLWDGSRLPLGENAAGPFEISIADAGVIGAILRKPSLDSIIQQYVHKGIDFSGGTLVDLGKQLQKDGKSVKLRPKDLAKLGLKLAPFLFAKPAAAKDDQGFEGDITGKKRKVADNKDFIQFHYDLSNDFYALFLDPEMVYSCAYYTDWTNTIEQAQRAKLEMI